jgi:hypothetical protein
MLSFKEFLNEAVKREIRWNTFPEIGWWKDKKKVTLYHGTHIENLDAVMKNGLNIVDPETGMISLAFEPNTGHGYASMYGGEQNFRKVGGKARHVPDEKRVVLVFNIPMNWIEKNMDPNFGGNMPHQKKNLSDKSEYEKFSGKDVTYYSLAELRIKNKVPAKFIVGYMRKKK